MISYPFPKWVKTSQNRKAHYYQNDNGLSFCKNYSIGSRELKAEPPVIVTEKEKCAKCKDLLK